MPGSSKKPLYLAKSISELNKKADVGASKVLNARIAVKSAEKLFKSAEELVIFGDEEKAYVLYMRFFNIITAIKKTAEFKKNEKFFSDLIGQKTCIKAIECAEELSKSLKDRYDENEAEKVSQKLEAARIEGENMKKEEEESERKRSEKEEEERKSVEEAKKGVETTPGFIDVRQLYSLFQDDTSVIIMDIRAQDQFNTSHINHPSCINVPSSMILPGCTVTTIEKDLSQETELVWYKRGQVDYIVLLDWWSSHEYPDKGSTISSLKDAIYKWDSQTTVRSEPLVLEGGYENWLLYYPTLTTNANVKPPPNKSQSLNTVPSLDSIEYDLDFLNPKSKTVEASAVGVNGAGEVPLNNKTDLSKVPSSQERNNLFDMSINDKNTWNDKEKVDNRILSEMRGDKVKNTNVITQGGRQPPEINRANKPQSGSKPTVVAGQVGSDAVSEDEWNAVHQAKEIKREELQRYERETKRLVAEQKARRAKLQDEERQLEKLAGMKKVELKETAELMREKRRIQQEIDAMKQEQAARLQEEKIRKEEYLELKQEEQEKLNRMKEVERMRAERKIKESEEKATRKIEEEKALAAMEQTKKEERDEAERRLRDERERTDREDEEMRRKEEDEQRAAEAARIKAEQDAMAEQEAAAAAKEKAQKETKEKEAQELEKQRAAKDQEKASMAAGDGNQIRKDPSGATVVNQNLPPGWEKVLDQTTGRYGYIDMNTQTLHWQPPVPDSPAKTSKSQTYKTKLKDEDEGSGGGGGMKRSHSSPNIAQMIQEENAAAAASVAKPKPAQPAQPSINRTMKPKPTQVQMPQVIKATEVSAAKVRNLNPTWGSMLQGLTGLRNLGNTCYMNSIIQCLSNTSFLTTYFLTDNYRMDINRENFLGTRGEVTEEFAVVIKALWSGQYRSITPRDFKYTVSKFNTMFAGYTQQDSQELLLFLMDGLHEDLNRIQKRPKLPELDTNNLHDNIAADKTWAMHKKINDSIIVDLFQGLFKSTMMCLTCRACSVKFDAFMYLSLPIPSSTRCSLRDCIIHFAKEEKMTGESRWACPKCKCKRDAVKKIVIWKLPPILLIHLKRFYYQGMWRQKITAFVDFPLEGLNLGDHVAGPQHKGPYNLYAVSNHYGTMEGGHYTAYCKHPANSHWYKYDDHEVNDIAPSSVKTSAAYTLFYSSIAQEFRLQ